MIKGSAPFGGRFKSFVGPRSVNSRNSMVDIFFSNYFSISAKALAKYGAYNISLNSDLPLFVDPFLLFNSKDQTYQKLHEDIITYVRFLRDQSVRGRVDAGTMQSWFIFSEIRQNWLGYSKTNNRGSGLGRDFGRALHANLSTLFKNFGEEQIAKGSHLEKLCLVGKGVGRDHVSDFTTNLIKEFLLDYTQTFARKHLEANQRKKFHVPRVRFNYHTETWASAEYELPCFENDYVLLTPRNLLTSEETWINRIDLVNDFHQVASGISNEQLRAQINNYFVSRLDEKSTKKERVAAAVATIQKFPEFVEYYIRYKEDHGDEARIVSQERVTRSEDLFVDRGQALAAKLQALGFYQHSPSTYDESHARIAYLKEVIENQDGHRLFYIKGKPIRREEDLQIMFRLTWWGSPSSVDREVNNGRGPADFSISRGSQDKTIVEFKLASNSQIRKNLKHQAEIYQKASKAQYVIKVILFFDEHERDRVKTILKELGQQENKDIVLIDAREKVSASKATDATEVKLE